MSSHPELVAAVLACCVAALVCGVWSLYVPFMWSGLVLAGAAASAIAAATFGLAVLMETTGGWSR